jgi:hypothetical protein
MDINVKDLNFSDEDIKLMLEGLEQLPNKYLASDIMIAMMDGVLSDNTDPNATIKRKQAIQDRENKRKDEMDELKENTIILRGKLLMFKRYLLQESALKQTNDILKNQ